ncbi:lantibiotic dehydratase [Streptomyces pseudovenezuelae]|uniref:Thiopeptide-type bacteriocin biosynthesis protein n=1 Tax=Streptomyces pseudovenezuelae TaxID=67350 RepID=A0ABT6M3N6_9ACTN|nr:lantibiotic dehydratase [Streptomyces pseudovenezuelae]MDH6222254.1 thiopeptide-type bacteriocin biosynthesis protein [Streptomyces pseudovenezuelae]
MYRHVDAAVVRAAVWRPDHPVVWPDLTGPSAHKAAWRAWLQQLWQATDFAIAVEFSSPDLARRVHQICVGGPVAELAVRRAVLSVVRYLLRARSRATPFGLFAGVEAARTGAAPVLRMGTGHRAVTRPDAAWTAALVDRLEEHRELRPQLTLLASSLAFERDGRLTIEHRSSSAIDGVPAHVGIRATEVVRMAMGGARAPVLWADLAETLSAGFPAASPTAIENLLANLVRQRFLITSLRPAVTASDPIAALLGQVQCLPAAEAAELGEVAAGLARHDDVTAAPASVAPAGARAERAWVMAAMTRLCPAAKPALALDLRLDWDLVIPEAVAKEAERAAAVLTRLAPRAALSLGWVAWHGRFLDRYGPGAVVPVLDAIDLLGYPSGYLGSTVASTGPTLTARDSRLLGLAYTAATRRSHQVRLDDAAIDELAVVDPGAPVQPSTEVTVRIHAASVSALEQGEFTLHVVGVARAAGTATGRFLHLFDADDRRRMTDVYAGLPGVQQDALIAQISTSPLYIRSANVAHTPQVGEVVIPLGDYDGPDRDQLPVTDLAVTADAEQLHLVSVSRRRPVHTMLLNAVDLTHHTHPLARFLIEAPVALGVPCTGFSWGAAVSSLPFLPALRYGRTVLSPARWTLGEDDLPGPRMPWRQWDQALAEWRRDVLLPEHVYLGDGDRRMNLDLAEPSHRVLLRTHVERDGKALLRAAPKPGDLGWTGGRAHEIVIPLAAVHQPRVPVRGSGDVVTREHGRLPGCGNLLSISLHGHRDRQDPLLTRHLPSLLGELGEPSWWFVRHRDPEDHLRLHLTCAPGALGTAVGQIGEWTRRLRRAGLITHASLDTYYPQTARFGGPAAMEAAGDYFAADAAAVLAQLTAQAGRGAPDARAVTAASMVDIAVGLLGDDAKAMRWLVGHTHTDRSAPPRAVYDQTIALTTAVLVPQAVGTPVLDTRVISSWSARRAALAAYRSALEGAGTLPPQDLLPDLLHLHHVRMHGPGLPEERAHLHLARAAALSWTARARGTT